MYSVMTLKMKKRRKRRKRKQKNTKDALKFVYQLFIQGGTSGNENFLFNICDNVKVRKVKRRSIVR